MMAHEIKTVRDLKDCGSWAFKTRALIAKRRLIRTPRPYFDESLNGLIVRATEENSYYSSFLLRSLANVRVDTKTYRTLFTKVRLKNLSETLNVDVPTLQDMACLKGIEELPPKFYNMFGHRIHKYSVRTTAPKVCPKCLRERNYARKIWDLAALTCCPKHKTLLIEKCPRCGRKISWSRHVVSVCKCGCDWRNVNLPQVSEEETTLSRLILKACGFSESGEHIVEKKEEEKSENPLSTVGLSELLCAVYFIAGQQNGVVDMTGKNYAVKLSHEELHKALTRAIMIFNNWPENYFKFLEESRGKTPNSERNNERDSGLCKDFGKLYDSLFIRKGNPLPDFLREAFKKYITTVWDGGYAGWCGSISSEELKERRYMTRYEVTKYLQVSLHTVNQLHRKGYLSGQYYPWVNRSRIMIEAQSVRELKDRWDKSINASQAGEMLGIGRIAVVSLVKSNCIAAIQGPAETGQLEWKFEVPEVERLLRLVEETIHGEKNLATIAPHVSFHKAIQKLSKLNLDIGAFVRLILDGKITPAAKGSGMGLSSLLFNTFEIEQYSRTEAIKRRGNKRTMREAALLLGDKTEVCVFLVEKGFLSAEKAAGGRRGTWVITQEEIDRFSGIYTTMNYIVEAFNTSTRGLIERLMANGIIPVTGPKVDGGRKYFFRKADLETADFSKILPNIKNSTLEKMNEKGLISKRQLADITGYSFDWITKVVEEGRVVPAAIKEHKDGDASSFFSHDQIQKLRELKEEERRQLMLFDKWQMERRAAA